MMGTVVVEVWKWTYSPTLGRNKVLHKSCRQSCRKTPKRFIVSGGIPRQFDHDGKCVARQGDSYRYNVLPETFEANE